MTTRNMKSLLLGASALTAAMVLTGSAFAASTGDQEVELVTVTAARTSTTGFVDEHVSKQRSTITQAFIDTAAGRSDGVPVPQHGAGPELHQHRPLRQQRRQPAPARYGRLAHLVHLGRHAAERHRQLRDLHQPGRRQRNHRRRRRQPGHDRRGYADGVRGRRRDRHQHQQAARHLWRDDRSVLWQRRLQARLRPPRHRRTSARGTPRPSSPARSPTTTSSRDRATNRRNRSTASSIRIWAPPGSSTSASISTRTATIFYNNVSYPAGVLSGRLFLGGAQDVTRRIRAR